MIAVDTNVLIYAFHRDSPQHAKAREAVGSMATGGEPWGLPVFAINEFLRVVTHPRVFHIPSDLKTAMDAVESLLSSPSVHVLRPGARYWPLFKETLVDGRASANLVFDAAIVAVCREHGARTILTADRDLRRFASIEVKDF